MHRNRLPILAASVLALALPAARLVAPAVASAAPAAAAAPQCQSQKRTAGDVKACIDPAAAPTYRVSAEFTNTTDQPLDVEAKFLISALGPDNQVDWADLGSCTITAAAPGQVASCTAEKSLPQAPSGKTIWMAQVAIPTDDSTPVMQTILRPADVPMADDTAASTRKVVELVNQERARAGCTAVQENAQLTAAAQKHSQDMATRGRFGHDGSNGSTFQARATAEGYTAASGENVGSGSDAATFMESIMNSPDHRANVLNCSNKSLGVGLVQVIGNAENATNNFWTQLFGTS